MDRKVDRPLMAKELQVLCPLYITAVVLTGTNPNASGHLRVKNLDLKASFILLVLLTIALTLTLYAILPRT